MSFRTYDPFREFANFERSRSRSTLDYDVVSNDDAVEIRIDIPGVDPATVDLTVEGRTLTVEAIRPSGDGEETAEPARRSRSLSKHRFELGRKLDADALEASYAFGVLTVKIPVAERAKPRKVEVGVGPTEIDAGTPASTDSAS